MTISYYHIFNLQNDTPELNKLVNDLEIKDLILQEKETIKWKIMQFMQSLRSDIHIIAENRYVDRVYRDSYYEYYATKRYQYSRNCIRLSFFENGFKPNVNFNDQNNIKDNYLGFLVLRPLIACIGRNVINPKAKIGPERDSKICKVEIYLEADYAIETSKTIVDKFIQNCDDNVIRTFLTSSRSFREHVTHCGSFSDGQKNVKAISSTFPESFESFSGNLK